jgi:hypothetical protein
MPIDVRAGLSKPAAAREFAETLSALAFPSTTKIVNVFKALR